MWNLARPTHLCEKAQPQHLHLFLGEILRLKLWQLYKDEVQALDNLFRVVDIGHGILMVVAGQIGLEGFIDKVERIDRLKKFEVLTFVQLPHIGLGSVEQYALLEFFRPYHLHLHKELPSLLILASHINDTVLFEWCLGNEFYGNIFYAPDLMLSIKRQEGIEQADDKVRMLTENSFERKVGTWV